MKPRIAVCALVLLFATSAMAATTPDFTGRWKLDPINSTGDTTKNGTIIISQSGDTLRFEYYTGTQPAGTETFVTDGRSRQRYKTRLGVAYSRARWQKNELVITTDTSLNSEGTQAFSESERWALSNDGNTLTSKSSDGKFLIYTKLPMEEQQ